MKAILNISAVAIIIVVASTPCFALWQTTPVFKKEAKALGMQVRSEPAGPNHVKVELEFKPQGKLKNFGSSVSWCPPGAFLRFSGVGV